MSDKIKAYYFCSTDKKLRYGDERQIRAGRTHKVKGDIMLCKNGLHASVKALDALGYAPSCYLWEVELSGVIVHGDDKCAASERKYIRGFNAEKLLRKFAREQALINIEKIKGYCSSDDYDLIYRWLITGDTKLQSAARYAARAAWSAAAARAARSAARESAWSAARAAWSAAAARAARSAARESAWASMSERSAAANEMLEQMIAGEFKRLGK